MKGIKLALLGLALCLFAGRALGQQVIIERSDSISNGSQRATSEYWTPERMRNAIPMDLGVVTAPQKSMNTISRPSRSRSGFVPSVEPKVNPSRILDLPKIQAVRTPLSDGAYANPYTTGLVFPDNQVNRYPYRTTGKLFFSDGGLDYACSASIVSRRIIISAAHCLYNTTANRWHSNFVFVPAYNANLGTQPFGTWNWRWAAISVFWKDGCECYPSPYDFGAIAVDDLVIGSSTRKIGEYLGWLGWTTFRLVGNNVTQLGYPQNLDSGRRMIQNNSQVRADGSVAGRIGTAMEKGASGGPWIQDFGRAAPDQLITSSGPNRVLGVTSYVILGQQFEGATILNDRWVSIFNSACAQQAGNC